MTALRWRARIGDITGSLDLDGFVRGLTREQRQSLYGLSPDQAFALLMNELGGIQRVDTRVFDELVDLVMYDSITFRNEAEVAKHLHSAKLLGPLSSLDEHIWNTGGDPSKQAPAAPEQPLFES